MIFLQFCFQDSKVTPLVLMFSKEEQIIVGFCVAGEVTQDQQGLVNSFTLMLEENIATLPPNATNIPKPSDIPDSKEVEEAKKKIVERPLKTEWCLDPEDVMLQELPEYRRDPL